MATRSMERLGSAVSDAATVQVIGPVPVGQKWQVREVSWAKPFGVGIGTWNMYVTAAGGGGPILALWYEDAVPGGNAFTMDHTELHHVIYAGEQINSFGTPAGLYAVVDGVVYTT